MTPLVSVVTPCYKQGHFLPEALESVLSQSCDDLEMIVVDDGSPDDTRAVTLRYAARDARVRYVGQPNRGLARARNAGLAAATGKFIVFLDADDRLLPDALLAGINSLEQHTGAAYTRGRFEVVDVHGAVIDYSPDDAIEVGDEYETLLRESPIWLPGCVMFRRAVLASEQPFDARADAAADLEMYLRLARLHPVARHDATVAQYRRHAQSMSMNRRMMTLAVYRVLQAQREHVARNEAWREAYRHAMREWEQRRLIPLMRDALRELARGDSNALVAGAPLMFRRGPLALTRAFWRYLDGPAMRHAAKNTPRQGEERKQSAALSSGASMTNSR